MISYAIYRVIGRRAYRGHKPGDTFEARLEPNAERRAIERGDIAMLERIDITLRKGSYALPKDWPPTGANSKETPAGVQTQGGEK